jgi:hypothetical protein
MQNRDDRASMPTVARNGDGITNKSGRLLPARAWAPVPRRSANPKPIRRELRGYGPLHASAVPELLDQIDADRASLTADGARLSVQGYE